MEIQIQYYAPYRGKKPSFTVISVGEISVWNLFNPEQKTLKTFRSRKNAEKFARAKAKRLHCEYTGINW